MKKLNCYRCGEEIYFDPNRKSERGKLIPLDPNTDEPHDCPKSNFKPRKPVGEEIMELDSREREATRRIKYD